MNLEKALKEISIKPELKKFTPHITIGRQVVLKDGFKKVENKIKIDNREIVVNKISLMESTRINGQLKYIPIYTRELK